MPLSPPLASGRSLPSPPRERRSSPRIEPRVSSYFSAVSSRYLASPPRPQPATVRAIASVRQRAAAAFVPKEIGRAHVRTPVTNTHLVCRQLLDKKKKTN